MAETQKDYVAVGTNTLLVAAWVLCAWLHGRCSALVCKSIAPHRPKYMIREVVELVETDHKIIQIEPVAEWLKTSAIPLETVEAGNGFSDLQPLKRILGDVRIIGLGEATHGTKEFFQLKHRLLEFLVEEAGYTVFAIEASYPACCNDLNDYVLYGKGDRESALASQGFWTWDTEEVSAMVDWTREHNKICSHGREVKFLGYDPQRIDKGMDVVESYLRRMAPDEIDAAAVAFAPVKELCKGISMASLEAAAAEREPVLSRLYRLIGFMAANQVPFVRMSSQAEYEWALQHARVVLQFFDSYAPMRAFKRDAYMAQNIEYIAKYLEPDAKIVVWAHNGHILDGISVDGPSMGTHLKRIFGERYYALGITFDRGSFQSRDSGSKQQFGPLTEFTVGSAPEGFVERYLSCVDHDRYIVDFRSAPVAGPVRDWLGASLPMRSIGSGYRADCRPTDYSQSVALDKAFDGMVFMRNTSRAVPNPTGIR